MQVDLSFRCRYGVLAMKKETKKISTSKRTSIILAERLLQPISTVELSVLVLEMHRITMSLLGCIICDLTNYNRAINAKCFRQGHCRQLRSVNGRIYQSERCLL